MTTAPGNSQITAPARAVDGARNSQITAPARAVDAHRCYTPPETKSGTGTAVLEFGYFFVGGGKGVSKTKIQVFGFIFFIFTRKCIANDICDRPAHFFTVTGSFFHFPPGGVHKQKGW